MYILLVIAGLALCLAMIVIAELLLDARAERRRNRRLQAWHHEARHDHGPRRHDEDYDARNEDWH